MKSVNSIHKFLDYNYFSFLLATLSKIRSPTFTISGDLLQFLFRYVVKFPCVASPLMADIHDIFGDKIKLLFNTRSPKPSIISFSKVLQAYEPKAIAETMVDAIGK